MSMKPAMSLVGRIGLTGILISMLIGLSSVGAEDPVQAEIAHLLVFVRDSECVFIRNGQVHKSRDAEIHIKRKYEHFKNRITTAEAFIYFTATRSMLSDRIYMIRCEEREMPSSTWLQSELDAFRRRTSKEGVTVAD